MNLYYPIIEMKANELHTFEVLIELTNGTATIEPQNAMATISGQGLGAQKRWDGRITVDEEIKMVELSGLPTNTIHDKVVAALITPKKNKRTYIKDGYRLEMITRNNSKTALLKKVPEEYLHAGLVENLISQKAFDASETTEIDLGHYPYWIHRTGSPSKGEYDCPNEDNANIRSHIFHGADGCWYGIARKTNQKYSYTYRDTEQFDHVSYEFYMDKIENGKCTSQKISVPSGVSDFYSIGMSGKWLMCVSSDSSKLYRLDTTNVANLERVTDYTYNSSNEYSYIVDDDMVINGWYFEDGKPAQKIGSIGYQSYCALIISQGSCVQSMTGHYRVRLVLKESAGRF